MLIQLIREAKSREESGLNKKGGPSRVKRRAKAKIKSAQGEGKGTNQLQVCKSLQAWGWLGFRVWCQSDVIENMCPNQPDCFGLKLVLSFIKETQHSLSQSPSHLISDLFAVLCFSILFSFFLPLFLPLTLLFDLSCFPSISWAHIHTHAQTHSCMFQHAHLHFSAKESLRSALNHLLIFQGKLLTVQLGHTRDSQRGFKFNPVVMFYSQLHV